MWISPPRPRARAGAECQECWQYLGRAQQQLVEVLEPGLDAVQDAAVDSVRPLESLSVRVHQAFHPEGTPGFTRSHSPFPPPIVNKQVIPGCSRSLPAQSVLGFWDCMILNQSPTRCLISNSTKTIFLLHFLHSIFLLLGPRTAPSIQRWRFC